MRTLKLTATAVTVMITSVLFIANDARGDDLRVIATGAFTAAFLDLIPEFERATNHKVVVAYGASIGNGPDTIPGRLRGGERVDVLIMARSALDDLIKQRIVVVSGRRDLVRSSLGMVVRAGARRPDIGSIDGLTRTLLEAKSIAYSAGTSGAYLSEQLFPRLGIADQLRAKSRRIEGEPVGAAVGRGEVEIGFQQISELLPVPGVDYVGPLPAGAQNVTIMTGAVVMGVRSSERATALIEFLASTGAGPALKRYGFALMSDRQ